MENIDIFQYPQEILRQVISTIKENIDEGIYVETSDRKLISINKKMCQMLELPNDQTSLLGADLSGLIDQVKNYFVDSENFLLKTKERYINNIKVIGEVFETKSGRTYVRSFIPIGVDEKTAGYLWIYKDITQDKSAENTLTKLNKLLNIANFAAQTFISNTNWRDSILSVFEKIGRSTEVSRVYLFETINSGEEDENGTVTVNQSYEWKNENITSHINDQSSHIVLFKRWYSLLKKNLPVYGNVVDFPEDERKILESREAKSIAVVPILVNGKFWGTLGMTDGVVERNWIFSEIEILQTIADILSLTIKKNIDEQKLMAQYEYTEKLNKFLVDREIKMVSLKEEIDKYKENEQEKN